MILVSSGDAPGRLAGRRGDLDEVLDAAHPFLGGPGGGSKSALLKLDFVDEFDELHDRLTRDVGITARITTMEPVNCGV